MKKELVKTSNYERFRTGISAVQQRGAPEAGLMLVVGPPGLSKSKIVSRWAVDNDAIYLRAKVGWTPRRFFIELAEALKLDVSGSMKEIFARCITAIGGEEQVPLVVDEVQHTLANGGRALEAIRDLCDMTESIVVLVAGEDRVQARIARYPQIASRISKVVEFLPASVDDVARCCEELAEIEIAPDLAKEIHRQAGGNMRNVINAIALIERIAKRNGSKKVSAADFAGKALVHDWQARRSRNAPSPDTAPQGR